MSDNGHSIPPGSSILPALSAVFVSCAALSLQLLDRPAVPLKPDVLLLELFLQLSLAGLCTTHLVPLQLVLGNGLPPLHVPCLALQYTTFAAVRSSTSSNVFASPAGRPRPRACPAPRPGPRPPSRAVPQGRGAWRPLGASAALPRSSLPKSCLLLPWSSSHFRHSATRSRTISFAFSFRRDIASASPAFCSDVSPPRNL